MAELKLSIGADVKQATQALKTFVTDVGKTATAVEHFGTDINNSFGNLQTKGLDTFRKTFVELKANLSSVTFAAIPPITVDVGPAKQALRTLAEEAQKAGITVSNSFGRIPLDDINAFKRTFQDLKNNLANVRFTPISPQFSTSLARANQQLQKLPRSSNEATLALSNLGRVAQDAPFGFIGIANNLNPLLESFQRLKATTGTTGGALKALGKSLMGAGGLGFALSVASSLLIVFGDKLFGLGGKAEKTNEEIEETARRIKELLKPLSEVSSAAVAGTTEELTKVGVLSAAVLDQTKSYEQRNNALNQLKKINESYFGDLTLETAKLSLLKERVDEYTEAIIAQAVIKGFSDEIGKLSVELNTQEKAFNDAAKNLKNYNNALANTKETHTSLTGEERISGEFVRAKKAAEGASKSFQEQGKTVGDLRNRMFELREAIKTAVESSLDFRPLEITKPEGTKSAIDETEKFINEAKKLAAELEKIGFIQPQFSFFDTLPEQLQKARKVFDDFNNKVFRLNPDFFKITPAFSEPPPEKVREFLNTVEEGLKRGIIERGGIDLPVDIDLSTSITTNFSQTAEFLRSELGKEITDAFKTLNIEIPEIDVNAPAGFNISSLVDKLREGIGPAARNATVKDLLAYAAEVQKGIDNINNIFKNIRIESVVSFSEVLGTALAGGDLRNIFTGFVNILADGLSAIGKQMIALSPVIAGLKAALKSLNPALLLPAGVALVAIGAALRATVGKGITGFAHGGLVYGPTVGLVGEGLNTSRSNPEVIAPLDKLKGMLGDLTGGGPQVIVLSTRIRSKDLILSQARGSRSQRRLGS